MCSLLFAMLCCVVIGVGNVGIGVGAAVVVVVDIAFVVGGVAGV